LNTHLPLKVPQSQPREVAKLSWLFPSETRYFRGQRWVYVGLRTLHLLGFAGLGAGFLYPAADQTWHNYYLITMFSGSILTLLFVWSNGVWLLQLGGMAILLKLVLIGLFPIWPEARTSLFVAVIIISGLIAHAPKHARHYPLFRRGRDERFRDSTDTHQPDRQREEKSRIQ